MADKEDKVGGWAGTLEDEEDEGGVQADIARKILAMNPRMRDAGVDTAAMIASSKQQDKKTPTAAPDAVRSAPRVLEAVAEIKKQLDSDERRIDTEIARLQKERLTMKERAMEQMVRWLMSNDPDLRSPVTQTVLDEERPFFDRIGFSVKKYVALQRKITK